MKRPAILLLLLCAAALPAAALAQGEADTQGLGGEILTTKWTLKQPGKKAPGHTVAAGPALPAPQRIKLPQPRQHRSQQRLPNNRTNAAPAIASVIRKKT
jgi:hypothetical protein